MYIVNVVYLDVWIKCKQNIEGPIYKQVSCLLDFIHEIYKFQNIQNLIIHDFVQKFLLRHAPMIIMKILVALIITYADNFAVVFQK